ncbi:hypothetical protein OG864_03310 [Streptomyces sp. NBC_00124]|uniref:hypothetical protein n=1 Tax=Streptomyces sp. NBC_00124 TaxID=2975662 RepID=UPI002258DF5E|nr:hypothetical protein [Streptomyces sp. NBC_00124]MCX5357754.1 hypothetical protein [Streptomyces sp. NBC_00124]
MSATPMIRTQYWNLATNTLRGGTTSHGESVTDVETGLLPLARATESSLHSWGVADGLGVTATANSPGVTVAPGTGLDVLGRLIALASGGVAVIDPSVDPGQMVNVPTVPVADSGVVLPTDTLTAGVLLLTLAFREVQDQGLLANAPVLLHAPWLRLQVPGDVPDDGRQLVLAQVTLSAGGTVTTLDAVRRRPVGLPVGRLELRRPIAATAPQLSVSHMAAAALAVGADGGVTLTGTAGGPAVPLLDVDATLTSLALLPGGGKVALGIATPPQTSLHVEGSPVHSGGPGGGFSFADRGTGSYVGNPGAGERWLWYAQDRTARLWSGGDVLTVSAVDKQVTLPGPVKLGVGISQAASRTLHVEGSEVHSGGPGGGFSFADRTVGSLVEMPDRGQRWVWYSLEGAGRLWSGKDLFTVAPTPDGGAGFGHPDGPATLSLWGSRISDVGGGALAIESGGTVVAFNGGDRVGIGTDSPGGQLEVVSPGTAIVANNTQDGFLRAAVFANGGLGVLAQGRGMGVFATGKNVGILASGATAGQFQGDVRITGSLSKGGGGFRIDHPLDPGNKYLSHSFVESPEMLNVYRGTVTTDDDGEATVELPSYVQVLNADVSYHLTVVGDVGAASVTEPLRDNRFSLRTDRRGADVCWLLLGVRQDSWAQTHRIQVEEDKPDDVRGRYLHPHLFEEGAQPAYAYAEYEQLLEGPEPSDE